MFVIVYSNTHKLSQQEHSYISGPILANPVCEEHSTSLMQEIFLVAQNSDEHQLQQYAAWAVSFLRYRLWSRERLNSANGTQTESAGSKSVSQGVPEDSAVLKLALWLKSFNHSGVSFLLMIYVLFDGNWNFLFLG